MLTNSNLRPSMVKHSEILATTAFLDLIHHTAVAMATTEIIMIRQEESHAESGEPEEKLEDKMVDGLMNHENDADERHLQA